VGIDFLSTLFDKVSVDFLFKIALFEVVDIPLIEYATSKGKPLVISCGKGSIDEFHGTVDACKRQ